MRKPGRASVVVVVCASIVSWGPCVYAESPLYLEIPRLTVTFGYLAVREIPDETRRVQSFNGIPVTLGRNTGGFVSAISLGAGLVLPYRAELTGHVGAIAGGAGGRHTWSEVGFPSDDFVGYTVRGWFVDLTGGYRVLGPMYLRAGIRMGDIEINSGYDAFGSFRSEHQYRLPYALLIGISAKDEERCRTFADKLYGAGDVLIAVSPASTGRSVSIMVGGHYGFVPVSFGKSSCCPGALCGPSAIAVSPQVTTSAL